MKIITLTFFICLVTGFTGLSQAKVWWGFEFGRGWGLADNGKSGDIGGKNKSGQMQLYIIRTKLGMYVSRDVSVGLGLGVNGYGNPVMTALPLVIDLRYQPIALAPTLFAYTNLGKSLIEDEYYSSSYVADIGVGYRLRWDKRLVFSPAIGYNLISYRMENDRMSDSERRSRHSIFLHVGISF